MMFLRWLVKLFSHTRRRVELTALIVQGLDGDKLMAAPRDRVGLDLLLCVTDTGTRLVRRAEVSDPAMFDAWLASFPAHELYWPDGTRAS